MWLMAVREFLVLHQKLLNLRLVLGPGSMPTEQEAFFTSLRLAARSRRL